MAIHMHFFKEGRLLHSYYGYSVPRIGDHVTFLGQDPLKVTTVLWCLGGATVVKIEVTDIN